MTISYCNPELSLH